MMSSNALGSYSPGSLESIFSSIFGDNGAPYKSASKQIQKYLEEAKNAQNPFYKAGANTIGGYQDWLSKMQDPSTFINSQMQNYQQSPWAKYLTDQSMRAGQNAASASGLTGSTPFAQQMQQNASNIASSDMNQWLQNVLGINTQYGAGLNNLMKGGQHSADILSELLSNAGNSMAALKYGQGAAGQNQAGSLIGGILGLFGL